MSEPKKFDAVTIIGLALAIAIIFYSIRQSQQKAEIERRRVEEVAAEEAKQAALVPPTKAPAGDNAGGKTDPAKPAENPDEEKAIAETPDITVVGDKLQVTFASKGAVVKSAVLPDSYIDPEKKGAKGLVILTEIAPGRHVFGIPKFSYEAPDSPATNVEFDSEKGTSLDKRVWELKDSGGFDASGVRTIAYSTTVKKLTITKTFTFNKADRFVKCSVAVENKTGKDGSLVYHLQGPQGIMPDIPPIDPKVGNSQPSAIQTEMAGRPLTPAGQAPGDPDVIQVYATSTGSEVDENKRSVSYEENLWGSVKNRFHMATIVSLDPRQLVRILAWKIQNVNNPDDKRLAEVNIGLVCYRRTVKLLNDTSQLDPYALYLGPADDRYVDEAEAAMKLPAPIHMHQGIQFCDIFSWRWPRVDWLARQLMWVFQALHKIFGSFGLSLLLTTVLIKLALHPLQRRMMVHMSKMQKLQPEIEKIKAKYKNQTSLEGQQRMQGEIRDLTMREGANPVAGCVPMLIQIPVLSALYGIFSHAFDMRGAEFLWIKDLSQPDHLAPLPFWPHWVNLLPILYIVLSYVQTAFAAAGQPKSTDPQQEMQKKMMMFMPVLIGVMWYSMMPAGLMLYFVISALWATSESWFIKKFVLHDPNAPVPPPSGI